MTDLGKVLIHSSVAKRYPQRIKRYGIILEKNDIAYQYIDASEEGFIHTVAKARAYIHHFVHRETEKQVASAVLPVIEETLKIPCYPNRQTRWHYDDKIMQYYLLEGSNYPCVDSWVFWDIDSASQWLKSAEFPLVFKLKAGAGAKNVVLVDNISQAKSLINSMFSAEGVDSSHIPISSNLDRFRNLFGLYRIRQKIAILRKNIHYQDVNTYWQRQRDYAYFQKFLARNDFDTRITVIGHRAFAYRRHNRENDFRASGSGNIDYNQKAIDKRCIRIATDISAHFGFQSMAYDFLFDEHNQPMIGEISFTFVDSLVHNCPGFFDLDMKFHKGQYWPQFCILQDLLGEAELMQPTIEDMME